MSPVVRDPIEIAKHNIALLIHHYGYARLSDTLHTKEEFFLGMQAYLEGRAIDHWLGRTRFDHACTGRTILLRPAQAQALRELRELRTLRPTKPDA